MLDPRISALEEDLDEVESSEEEDEEEEKVTALDSPVRTRARTQDQFVVTLSEMFLSPPAARETPDT